MRYYIVFFTLCLILFIFPLQIFIIGNFTGVGVQGAVYRYQITDYGTSFIPITREIVFVLSGILSGRTVLSVLLWVSGTMLLTSTTIFACLHIRDKNENYYRQIVQGLIVSCIIYLGSCVVQYGFFFHGPGGISLPVGIIAIPCWILVLLYYQHSSKKKQEVP